MAGKLFGTDGVRGRVGESPMTPDILVRLGFSAGRALCTAHDSPQVLIGKDTRLSGYMVESALEAGFAAAGVDVLLSGPLPTAAVSYLTQTLRLSAGVVISASHNPHNDNGVKFFGADGQKLSDEMQAQIERGMDAPTVFTGNPGRARRLDAAADRYIEFCKRAFPPRRTLRGLRILADCANGAAYHVAPPVLHELGAEVVPFAASPDGMNINVDCGVMHPAPAANAVLQNAADVAVILDGDGDRVFMADEKGEVYDGDALLFVIATDLHRRGETPKGVVGTSMSNAALESAVREMGADFSRRSGRPDVLGALENAAGKSAANRPGIWCCAICTTPATALLPLCKFSRLCVSAGDRFPRCWRIIVRIRNIKKMCALKTANARSIQIRRRKKLPKQNRVSAAAGLSCVRPAPKNYSRNGGSRRRRNGTARGGRNRRNIGGGVVLFFRENVR